MQDHGLRVGNISDQTPPSSAAGGIDWATNQSDPIGTLTFDNGSSIDTHVRSAAQSLAVGGHSISYNDDFTEFECTTCGTEFAVPDIFQASSGFRQAVYQLYIIGHYRHNECPGPEEKDLDDILDDLDDNGNTTPPNWPPTTTPPADPNRIYWQDPNTVWRVDTGNGTVTTDGGLVFDSTDPDYYAGDMLTEKDFMELHSDSTGMRQMD